MLLAQAASNTMANFIITTSADGKSGSKYFLELAKAMIDRSHSVVVIVGKKIAAEFTVDPRITLVQWPSERPIHWSDFRFLMRLIRTHRSDCVIGNFGAVNISLIAAWLQRVPVRVAWYRTLSTQLAADHPQPRWRKWALNRRKQFVYGLATHLIANSDAAKKDLQSVYRVKGRKCHAMHFLLADPHCVSTTKDAAKIVCVGRLHPSKGQDILIRALPEVRRHCPDAHVEFIGSGSELGTLMNLAGELGVSGECRFVGSKSPREVLQAIAGSAVCVVPSRNEAFGWVSVEALSVGTAVVGSEIDGIREVVSENRSGLLFPPGDAGRLAACVRTLLQDAELRTQMSAAARREFEHRFSLSHIDRHVEFFERLVAKSGR